MVVENLAPPGYTGRLVFCGLVGGLISTNWHAGCGKERQFSLRVWEIVMSLAAKLVVVGGEVKTAEIKLRLPSTIGRGRDSTIMLRHPLVSRLHCELYEQDGQLMVRDLGSLNGTFINNQKITESSLPPGELLTVGTVTFRAVYDSADTAASAPPAAAAERTATSAHQATTVRAPAKSKPEAGHHAGNGKSAPPPSVTPPSGSDLGCTERADATLEELDDVEEILDPTSLGSGAIEKTESIEEIETIEDEDEDDLNDFLKNIK